MTRTKRLFDEALVAQQYAGATARAAGVSQFASPLYRSENMPAATGEPVKAWSAKVEAWTLGWKIENAIRESR